MEQLIITEDMIDGILWCFLVAGGLFFIFLLVALIMLMTIDPKCPDHVRRMGP